MLWNESLKTGVRHLDDCNKELLDRIDALMKAEDAHLVNELLDWIEAYATRHFAEEQELHAAYGYPKAAAHKRLHECYMVIFQRLKRHCLTEGLTLPNVMSLNRNVVEGLRKHIAEHDRDFAEFYKRLPEEAAG